MLLAWVRETEPLVRNEVAQGSFAFSGLYQSGEHSASRSEVRGSYLSLLQRADDCLVEFFSRRVGHSEPLEVTQVVVTQATCKDQNALLSTGALSLTLGKRDPPRTSVQQRLRPESTLFQASDYHQC